MLAVANGYGLDSLAMLVGMHQRGIRPDCILHAAVGGEMDHTYAIMPVVEDWLESVGFPQTTIVKNVPKNFKHWPPYYTLEENCLTNGTLPSISFQGPGKGACSMKWKQAPQHAYLKQDAEAVAEWVAGRKIVKAIGYDFSPADQKRTKSCNTYTADQTKAEFYDYWYPLQEWQWDRDENARQIRAAGIHGVTEEWLAHGKSSCFFCFSMQEWEVRRLSKSQLRRIVLLEARALPRLTAVDGLWGQSYTYKKHGSKDGRYKAGETASGSMTEFIREECLLTADEIAHIQTVPAELVKFQGDFAAGRTIQPLGMWLAENFPEMYPSYPTKAHVVEIECEDEPLQPNLFPILGNQNFPILFA